MDYYKRSPFLFIYWAKRNKTIVYNYNSHTKAIISKGILELLEILSVWKSGKKLQNILGYPRRDLDRTLTDLIRLEMIHKKPMKKEDFPAAYQLENWNPIDLAMQRQTSYGGYIPALIKGKPPAAFKKVKRLSSLKLSEKNPFYNNNRSFFDVLENRESIRHYDQKKHINKNELSSFLESCAKIRNISKHPILGMITKRPYPSAGARYPLEIYVVNNNIRDVRKGIHYYNPLNHEIIFNSLGPAYREKLNEYVMKAQGSSTMNAKPDVVFIITAVFGRTMWKYKNIGLSHILNDLGCLYQTMYLVATAMNLAPCVVSGSYEILIRDWLKLDWFNESHVGTFALGKKITAK